MPCERCAQMPGLCRQCEREQAAEHFHRVHEAARAQALYRGDVARLPYERIAQADRAGWRAVADAAREMAR